MENMAEERLCSAEIDLLKRMQEEMYLARLLNGEYGSEEEALQTPERCRFQLKADHYAVLSISVDDFSSTWLSSSMNSFESLRNTIIPQIRDVFFGFLAGIYENYYCVLDRTMTIIICLQEEDLTTEGAVAIGVIRKKTMECTERLKEQGILASVMLSKICDGAMGIRDAYVQIKQLREYRRILDLKEDFLVYGLVDQPKGTVTVARREFDAVLAYIDAIQKQSYASARSELRTLTEILFTPKAVIPINIETTYHYYIHILFLSVEEIKKRTSGRMEELLMPERLFSPDYSVPEILEKMEQVLMQLETLHQQGEMEESSPSWYSAVLRYIEDHFTDVSLNVSSIADRFSMNPAFLSRSFKSIAGVRLLDHINMLRVRYAKKQILAGDTVTQAAEKAGFGSVLTMRRAFVKFEGTLPSRL